MFIGRTDVEAETPILWPPDVESWLIWKDPDAGKDWGREEEGDDRGWDGGMASSTQWTWVWVNSGSWWWTGRPGELQSMGSQRAGHDWATELIWTELNLVSNYVTSFFSYLKLSNYPILLTDKYNLILVSLLNLTKNMKIIIYTTY